MIALWLAWVGVAEAHEIRLCGQFTPAYLEGNTADDDGLDHNDDGVVDNDRPDFMTNNAPQPLRGMWLVAEAKSLTGQWGPAWWGYAPATGPNAGCTDLFTPVASNLLGNSEVRLTYVSEIEVGGHTVSVRNTNIDDTVAVGTMPPVNLGPLIVTAPGRYDLDFGRSETRRDMAAALAWALARADGGVDPMTLTAYASCKVVNGTCDGGGSYNHPQKVIFGGPSNTLSTYFHELGHALTQHKATSSYDLDYSWDQHDPAVSNCATPDSTALHDRNSDEATAMAMEEGFASYYAAVILNRTDELDAFLYGNFDWDRNPLVVEDSNYHALHREPTPDNLPSMARNYWGDQCAQGLDNLSNEYDWTRMFWDLDTARGMTFALNLDIYTTAIDFSGTNWWAPVDSCPGSFCTEERLTAVALGFNGTDYGFANTFDIHEAFVDACEEHGPCAP